MCYYLLHRKSMTALERNPKQYIEKQFHWLQDRGYRLTYSFMNGENEFWYENSLSRVYIYYDDLDTVACRISYGRPRHSHDIDAFLDDGEKKQYDHLSTEDKIDFLADRIKGILDNLG